MSALGQKQTCAVQNVMSALPPTADIGRDLCEAPVLKDGRRRDLQCGAVYRLIYIFRQFPKPLVHSMLARIAPSR